MLFVALVVVVVAVITGRGHMHMDSCVVHNLVVDGSVRCKCCWGHTGGEEST